MAKTAKYSARSSAPSRSGGGLMLGIFVGLLLGLGLALGVALYLNKTPLPFLGKPKPAEPKDAKGAPGETAKPPAVAGMPQGGAREGDKPKYDFYKILPGGEEPVSEKELKDAAKAGKDQPEAKGVYFIQAGSFQNPADADNRKAQLAILGFEAAVEPISLPDKGTWYRVRLGPYTKIDEINKMRSTMATNGIDVSLVKIKDPAQAKSN